MAIVKMDCSQSILPRCLEADTPFVNNGEPLHMTILDFWKWGFSSITDNTLRGIVAEYLVAKATCCTENARQEWKSYDLDTQDGIKIEVKSAAYLQSWTQTKPSKIQFGCQKTLEASGGTYDPNSEKKRHADVYVFALLKHDCKETLNPLDVSQWEFYVVPTWKLDERVRSQSSITLPSFKELECNCTSFRDLSDAIKDASKSQREHLSNCFHCE